MKTFLPAAALVACAFAPIATQAATPQTALNACVKAFTTTYLPGHAVKAIRANAAPSGPTLMLFRPSEYTIALTARGVTSGRVLAEARCIANGKGVVVVLDSPADASYVAKADFVVSLR